MEAKVNESGYTALKRLDQAGELLFELSYVFFFELVRGTQCNLPSTGLSSRI
jgi:hypothetical protein